MSRPGERSRKASRLLACFLWVYPAAFRDEYEGEMRKVLRQRWRDEAEGRGVVEIALLSAAVIWDIFRTACEEHKSMLMQDLKFTGRALRRSPLFATAAILTMALGIGANTAIFSVVDHAILRPLPFPESDRLVMVRLPHPTEHDVGLSPADFLDWRSQNRVFDSVSAYVDDVTTIIGAGEPFVAPAARVTDQFFSTLKAHAILGRTFERGDDSPGRPLTVVLSAELWRARFHEDRDIIGRSVVLDSKPHTIIGVMDAGFGFPTRRDMLWIIRTMETPACRCPYFLTGLARIHGGMTTKEAVARLNASVYPVVQAEGESRRKPIRFYVQPLQQAMTGSIRTSLLVVLGAVMLVLIMACINVANLFLARSTARRREVLVRLSLGANMRRLVRQHLTESLTVATLGALAGTLFAVVALRWYRLAMPEFVPAFGPPGIDGRVLVFTGAMVLFSGLLFGLAPAFQGLRLDIHSLLRAGRDNTGGRMVGRTALIAFEVALAFMLVTGAGLLVKSFARLSNVGMGARPDHLMTFQLSLPEQTYSTSRSVKAFYARLMDEIGRLPGVLAAGAGSGMPPDLLNFADEFTIDGQPIRPGEPVPVAPLVISTPNYLQTLGIPVLKGRGFGESDTKDAPPVAVISRAMARKYFGTADPIGRRIKQGDQKRDNPWMEIVGVAADAKYNGLESEDRPALYKPLAQHSMSDLIVAVRTAGDPERLAPALRTAVASLDKNLALDHVQTMEQNIADSVARPRFRAALMAVFAAFGLLLAAVGIYGVVAYSVARRTAELGLRMALGAQRAAVLGLVVRQGMKPTLAGLAAGAIGALALARVLRSLLFGVEPQDPLTLAAAAVLLGGVALIACLAPALRATRIDPVLALRNE